MSLTVTGFTDALEIETKQNIDYSSTSSEQLTEITADFHQEPFYHTALTRSFINRA